MMTWMSMSKYYLFQSTLSQGERHDSTGVMPSYHGISIHALARRATRLGYVFFYL